MTEAQLKQAMYDWASAALPGVTVAHALHPKRGEAGAPVPDRPFCSIRLGTATAQGEDSEEPKDDGAGGMTIEFRGQRQVVVSFRLFADDARDQLAKLKQATNKPSLCEILEAGGVAFVGEAGTIDASEQLGGFWDGRAQADFTFAFTEVYTDTDTSWIETYSYSGTLQHSEDDADPETVTTQGNLAP